MIYCATQKLEAYGKLHDGEMIGLWPICEGDKLLFNLISRTYSHMFLWEQQFKDYPTKYKKFLMDLMPWRETLRKGKVDGRSLTDILMETTPEEMLEIFQNANEIPEFLANFYSASEDSRDTLLRAMRWRVLQYKKFSAVVPTIKGKVIKIQFGGGITIEEDEELARVLDVYREGIKKAQEQNK